MRRLEHPEQCRQRLRGLARLWVQILRKSILGALGSGSTPPAHIARVQNIAISQLARYPQTNPQSWTRLKFLLPVFMDEDPSGTLTVALPFPKRHQ
jgi:hypothetical protein